MEIVGVKKSHCRELVLAPKFNRNVKLSSPYLNTFFFKVKIYFLIGRQVKYNRGVGWGESGSIILHVFYFFKKKKNPYH